MPACGGKLQVAVSAAARWVPMTERERVGCSSGQDTAGSMMVY
jgi:hypothetical protein